MNRFVLTLVYKYKTQFYCGLILALFLGVFSVVISSLAGPSLKLLTDATAGDISWKNLFGEILGLYLTKMTGEASIQTSALLAKIPIYLVIFAFLKALSTGLQWSLFENLGEKISRDLRAEIVELFVNSSFQYLYQNESEEKSFDHKLSSGIGNDIRFLREYIVHFWGGLPREGFQLFLQGIFLILLSPKLFLFFLIALVPIGLILAQLGRKIRKRSKKMLTDFSSLTEWLQQRLLGYETIKQFKTEKIEQQKFAILSYNLSQKALATDRVKARTAPLVELMGLLGFSGVLMLALKFSHQSQIPGSVLLSFFTALALFSQALGNLSRYFNSNREAKEAVLRLLELKSLLTAAKLKTQKLLLTTSEKTYLEIKDLNFCFGEKIILENFNKTLSGGNIYGIAGPSGVGKSTLMKILLGLLPPKSGKLAFFASQESAYPVAYVPQTMTAFEGTVGENIAYPLVDFKEHEIYEALEKVKMKEFVKNLRGGLSTLIVDAGFSGGQLQRIFFARIFYLKSLFIFIDEGTSAQDPENEKIILDALTELKLQNRCVIMIAHRENVKMFCDELIYLAPLRSDK